MDFLKKNWGKILLSAGALVCAIIMIIPCVTAPEFNFIGASQVLGLLLFFVGVCAYYIVKMFDRAKLASICVLLATGVLTTTFLGIGFIGFNANKDKAQGAMGNAYANYKTLADTDVKAQTLAGISMSAGKIYKNFDEVNATVETLKGMKNGLTVTLSTIPDNAPLSTISGLPNFPTSAELQQLFGGLTTSIGLNLPATTTKAEAVATLNAKINAMETAMNDIEKNEKRANYVADTLFYIYLVTFLTFGLAPIAKARKKLVRHICK